MGKLTDDVLKWTLDINGDPARKELTQVGNATNKLERDNKALSTEMAKLEAHGKKGSDEWKKYEAQIKANSTTIDANKKRMEQLRKEVGLTSLSATELRKEMGNLKRQMDRMDPNTKEWKAANTQLTAMQSRLGQIRGGMSSVNGVFGAFKTLLPAMGIGAAVGLLTNLGRQIISVRSEFEKYEAVLTNTLGSNKAARKELAMLSEIAAKTPFALTELTGGFVKLTNYGLKPSRQELIKYGDLASSVGKGFDQLVEAVADATTFEFERLKEFGIKAKKEGDKITFTFKEQSTVVDANTQSIKNYVLGLGELKGVSGAMAAIAETLGGRISNIGDAWDRMLNKMGEGTTGVMVPALNGIQKDLDDWSKLFDIWADDRISKWEGFLASFSQVQMDKVWNKLENERYFEAMRNVVQEESSLVGSAIEKQQKETAKKKAEQLAKDIEDAKKAAKDKIENEKKVAKALVEFLAKDVIEQQDAINKYFHDAGEEAFDSFMKAIEEKQKNGMDFSILPEFKEEKEKKDPAADYAMLKFKETQSWVELEYKTGIIGKQEYEDKLTEIAKKAEEERQEKKMSGLQKAQELSQIGANFISAMMDYELEKAGDNEEKKAAIRKKYANAQFLVTASQIVIDTAAAIMKSLAQLGPIAGPIAAAIVGATGAVQLGIANQERQKMMGSKQSGGYADRDQRDDTPAGIYHANEFIASAPAVRNPTVKPILDIIDMAQRYGTIRSLNLSAMVGGRKSGGYASASPSTGSGSGAPIMGNDVLTRVAMALENNEKQMKRIEKWKPTIYTEQVKKDLDEWENITNNRGL